MKDETLRLALEALKTCQIDGDGWSGPDYWFDSEKVGKAIIAIRQALEQPEPEPVAFYVYKPTLPTGHLGNVSDGDLPWVYDQDPSSGYEARMLVYTSPPKREPLTDEEILDCWKQAYEPGRREHDNAARMARAIEAAHGIKGEA